MYQFRFGPLLLTTTYTTNILNPGTTTGGTNSTSAPYNKLWIILNHVIIINVDVANRTFRLFMGGTGGNTAGTEFMGYDKVVPANDSVEWFGMFRMDSTVYLVGGASAANTLTIQGEGEIGVMAG